MFFDVGTVGRIENVDAFVVAQDSIKSAASDLGATSLCVTQVILGGRKPRCGSGRISCSHQRRGHGRWGWHDQKRSY